MILEDKSNSEACGMWWYYSIWWSGAVIFEAVREGEVNVELRAEQGHGGEEANSQQSSRVKLIWEGKWKFFNFFGCRTYALKSFPT